MACLLFSNNVCKQQMAFAKNKERFPTFLTGGFSWTTSTYSQTTPLTPKPILQTKTVQQTSFLGYRSYLAKHRKNVAQVSPSSQVDEESPSSLSPQTQ